MNQVAAMIRRIILRLVMLLHEPSHAPTHDSDGSWYVSYAEEILHHRKNVLSDGGKNFGDLKLPPCIVGLSDLRQSRATHVCNCVCSAKGSGFPRCSQNTLAPRVWGH